MDPDVLGDHEVVRPIAQGGMGSVYEVRDRKTGATRAAKVIRAATDQRAKDRFRREAQLLARCDQHSGIVKVHSIGEGSVGIYIIMDLVEGEDLGKIIERGGKLEPRRAARIGLEVARALAFVHARGIVHRDVKPSNILIEGSGRALLTDFGIATAVDLERLTRTGTFLGTVGYSSPEQVSGRAVAASTDTFSLGLVLFHALTGEPPFDTTDNLTCLARLVSDAPVRDVRSVAPEVPAALAEVVAHAVEKAPERRYASAHELAHDLDAFLEGRLRSRSRWRARRGILAALAVLALGGGLGWGLHPASLASASPGTPEERVARARQLLSAGRLDEARRELSGLPESARVLETLADVAIVASDYAAAEELLGRALRTAPNLLAKHAAAAALAGDDATVFSELPVLLASPGTAKDPRLAPALYRRGLVTEDPVARGHDLDAASALAPPPPALRREVARALRALVERETATWERLPVEEPGRILAAIARGDRATALDPSIPPRHRGLAFRAIAVGLVAEDRAQLHRATAQLLDASPDEPLWNYLAAMIRGESRDDAPKAIEQLQRAIDHFPPPRPDDGPEIADFAHRIVRELCHLDTVAATPTDLERAMRLAERAPDDAIMWVGIAECLGKRREFERANAALARAHVTEPSLDRDEQFFVARVEAHLLFDQGRRSEALEKARDASSRLGERAMADYGKLLLEADDPEAVVRLVNAETGPDEARNVLVKALLRLGRTEEARDVLARLRAKLGATDSSVKELEKLLR
ncbi:MAG TPA: protein kinase [Planctomycetota bacterium]|nr:protein kinase [Planctomycetota bacterium]